MASQKLVRCEIRRPDSAGGPTVRYVPLEIFGLWEFLMRTKHRFEVTRSVASLLDFPWFLSGPLPRNGTGGARPIPDFTVGSTIRAAVSRERERWMGA